MIDPRGALSKGPSFVVLYTLPGSAVLMKLFYFLKRGFFHEDTSEQKELKGLDGFKFPYVEDFFAQ